MTKYYITGVELGILMSQDQKMKEKILDNIILKNTINLNQQLENKDDGYKGCKYNVGDWCHHPYLGTQEECPFYWNPEDCEDYEPEEKVLNPKNKYEVEETNLNDVIKFGEKIINSDKKLKTLRDLPKAIHLVNNYNNDLGAFTEEELLKQEAIKWIKEDREFIFGQESKDLSDFKCLKIIEGRWKERFNLTEEDLK